MKRKKISKILAVLLPAVALVFSISCGGSTTDSDADTADAQDVPGEADAAEDIQQEDEVTTDPVEEDAAVEEIAEEDIEEEEVITETCPVLTAGTASIGGTLTRGSNMLMDPADTAMDGIGNITIVIFDQDPFYAEDIDPVAFEFIMSADLSSETDYVNFCIQNIPSGEFWAGIIMDDDDSGLDDGPGYGDIAAIPLPTGTLAPDESISDASYELNVRVGRVYGNISIDSDLAAAHSDLTGDLYILIVDDLTSTAEGLGSAIYEGVTMSPDADQPYEVLIALPPTSTNKGYLAVIFDVDESGIPSGPQTGDLVNFTETPHVEPPDFTYAISGIEENINTMIFAEF